MIFGAQFLKQNPEGPFAGEFRLRDYQTLVSESGQTYGKGMLEDATGQIPAYWWGDGEGEFYWTERLVMYVQGNTQRLGDRTIVRVSSMEDRFLEGPARGVRVIPQTLAQDPAVLLQVVEAVDQIQTRSLQEFCDRLFDDLEFARKFFTVPASRDNHHAFPGGLAAHSVAVAKAAAQDARLSQRERDLAMVGGLLHDVGKTITCDPLRPHPVYLDHDLLSLEILSRPLSELDKKDSKLADSLRYILTCRRAQPRKAPRTPSAVAVWSADRQDAASNMSARADA